MEHDPFLPFDFAALKDPEFKEDSVREDLIAPLLKRLGYAATGSNRIVRSRVLEHPYVAIGTTSHKISLVPDYLLHIDERPAWILDAKSPRERVDDPKHVGQGYSYAIHRDIRVDIFAVCNGHELAVFSVKDMSSDPLVKFRLADISSHWGALEGLLGPAAFRHAFSSQAKEEFAKDFGILLMKLNIRPEVNLILPSVPVFQIGRVSHDLYSIGGAAQIDDSKYFASFDFSSDLFLKLLAIMPDKIAEKTRAVLSNRFPALLRYSSPPILLSIEANLGSQILENKDEHYVPLQVKDFRAART